MKRSELKLTGEIYRLTPDSWGDTYIMVDEDEVMREAAEAFNISFEDCDPDRDPNNRPASVQIATSPEGRFYAIIENMYRSCDNPAEAIRGSVKLHGNTWDIFDEESDK